MQHYTDQEIANTAAQKREKKFYQKTGGQHRTDSLLQP